MVTALQPRLTRRPARLHALPTTRPPLRRVELDALGFRWRLALDAARTALQAAPGTLRPESLRGRANLLSAERMETANLLEHLARELGVNGWLSGLESLAPSRPGRQAHRDNALELKRIGSHPYA